MAELSAYVWKGIPEHEQRVYRFILAAFFGVLFTYWLVRPLKTGVFLGLVGVQSEPVAKLGTLVILFPILMAYAKLVNLVGTPRRLVAIVCTLYALIFAAIAFFSLLAFRSNANEREGYAWLGWTAYWTIESFGSVCVAMLWSVIASFVAKASAPLLYPLITVVCQVAAICGATTATFAKQAGFAALFLLAALCCLGIVLCVAAAFSGLRRAPLPGLLPVQKQHDQSCPSNGAQELMEPHLTSEAETGLWEGLRLVFDTEYVLSIMVVSTFCEVIATILDFQMKVIVRESYGSAEDVAAFMGFFGQMTNVTSLVFALVGTQAAIRHFGLRFCLLAYPAGCLFVTVLVFFYPLLSVLVFAMVCLKAFNYSLNNPSKELLYLRTSHDIKYKAKSWIDMFGTRGAKSAGSLVNQFLKHSKTSLLQGGSLVSAGFVVVWMIVANRLGHAHLAMVERDVVVGVTVADDRKRISL